jgi:aminopeptidase YwaD
MRRPATVLVLVGLLLAGCTDDGEAPVADPPAQTPPAVPDASGPTGTATSPASSTPPPPPTSPPPQQRVSPGDADLRIAVAAVEHLAGRIGPRPGTSPAYHRAADWVDRQLAAGGWSVRRQRVPTPAGSSEWGGAVAAGTSVNLIATRGELEPGTPWLLVGAHLDTVPNAPGAEDNASGIGVLLTVAQALVDRRSRLPVVLVAFGSEEPRGTGDDDHHYGSRAFVDSLGPAQRRSLRGMVSMDRVGVGSVLPIKSVAEPSALREELVAAARRAGVEVLLETGHESSDHESFHDAGMPGVRLGGTSYCCYHDESDLPPVVDRAQLARTARTVLAWLR